MFSIHKSQDLKCLAHNLKLYCLKYFFNRIKKSTILIFKIQLVLITSKTIRVRSILRSLFRLKGLKHKFIKKTFTYRTLTGRDEIV